MGGEVAGRRALNGAVVGFNVVDDGYIESNLSHVHKRWAVLNPYLTVAGVRRGLKSLRRIFVEAYHGEKFRWRSSRLAPRRPTHNFFFVTARARCGGCAREDCQYHAGLGITRSKQ